MMNNNNSNRIRGLSLSEELKLNNKRHKADKNETLRSPSLSNTNKNNSNRQACLNEEINGKTREDVLIEKLNEYKEQNIKFNRINDVKLKIQAALALYGFEERKSYVNNKISKTKILNKFVKSYLLGTYT